MRCAQNALTKLYVRVFREDVNFLREISINEVSEVTETKVR